MAWYVLATQPGCKPCSVIFKMSLVVIVWPLGSKTGQTSKIRRDSENWVILGHTPKLPKIIDRRNVQVYIYIIYICACMCVYICVCMWNMSEIRHAAAELVQFWSSNGAIVRLLHSNL